MSGIELPKISVVILSFNQAKYLEATMRCLADIYRLNPHGGAA
jgi:glycosyltransferase involved in cell wall biosynthesis